MGAECIRLRGGSVPSTNIPDPDNAGVGIDGKASYQCKFLTPQRYLRCFFTPR